MSMVFFLDCSSFLFKLETRYKTLENLVGLLETI